MGTSCHDKKDNPLSGVNGVFNAILVDGNAVGEVMFYGQGAGMMPTASAVVADIMDVKNH
ncbi:homoserine dehydrogenase, partial [Thermoanaerobacter ethanolicus JW 200]